MACGIGKARARRRGPVSTTLLCLAALVALALPAAAGAANPPLLWQAPLSGQAGPGAGQLDNPRGVATDPNTGHVYVADRRNARVSEFDAWGQFMKAWGWGVANGAPELQACGPAAVPPTATCQAGLEGSGAGQFAKLLGGIAVDAAGDVFVGDLQNYRVEKFDSEGNFLLAFGSKGTGDGQFETQEFGSYIAASPSGTVFVGDKGRVQEFNANGTFKSKVVFEGDLEKFEGQVIQSLAVDQAGNLYLVAGSANEVLKMSPAGTPLFTFPVDKPRGGLAVDNAGNLYVARDSREIVVFDAGGNTIVAPGSGFGDAGIALLDIATSTVTSAGGVDIYGAWSNGIGSSFTRAYGPPPDKWPQPEIPPEIKSQFATSVDSDGAVLQARINPHFWADTRYFVEYGTGECSNGGCPAQLPVPPGALLGAGVVDAPVITAAITLPGLAPKTTYHYRFVAESSGGGPVRGVDGEVGNDGAEGVFTTPALPLPPNAACPNQVFRTGAAARLPDCRAYEMVSPVDKNNTDIISLININSNLAALNQSALSGEKITYTTSQGFGDSQGVPYVSQYIASRNPGTGWQSHGITAPQGSVSPVDIGNRIDVSYRAFTTDLCSSVFQHTTDPPLADGAPEGFVNLYRRQNCGEEGYEAVTRAAPPDRLPNLYLPEVQGLSADGRCTVFYAPDKLTPDAAAGSPPEGTNRQLYETCDGTTRLISILPAGNPSKSHSSAGTANSASVGIRTATDARAVSEDGSRVYWTAEAAPSKLYVRVNAQQPQSKVSAGNCTEPAKACTIRVSETVPEGEAHFWSATPDGSKALFTVAEAGSEKLYEFDLASESSTPIASGVVGMLGASENGSRVYFLSEGVLAGANAQGESPAAGKPNLYLFDANRSGSDRYRFIEIFSSDDALTESGVGGKLSPVHLFPFQKTSRVTPDGRHIVFMSNASLTGYDNVDAANEEADAEVFTYDADSGALSCVSCNPSGQRPAGRNLVVEGFFSETWAAARIATYPSELYGSRVISDDGSRVFFDSFEALVPGDTNGKADVYQWESVDAGDCKVGGPGHSPPNGGCVSLISSGESPSDSVFLDASSNGADVFFATDSSLVGQDPGLIDIYDARVGGGFPPPLPSPPECEGEACQRPPVLPVDPTPASAVFQGAGNVRQGKGPRPCPKGKVRRKGRCVVKGKKTQNKGKRGQRRAGDKGRAAR